ncbi:(3S,6E)-nerolidol synthase 1-like [Cornus florida]|uniref:(3S,6E)-nerolidol synthase 1-like n=1 Tax=Cornus florida TaxID=4283 RepID=UPI00289FC90A|nr:(3S,6E)-nerolidol synthase 1-like [Cornus florida]
MSGYISKSSTSAKYTSVTNFETLSMALFHSMSISTKITPKTIPQTGNTVLAHFATIPTTQKWSISETLTLASKPSKQENLKIEYANFTDELHMKHEQKLNEVRYAFSKVGEDELEDLVMIDAVQRLGIDYHFHKEIDAVLQRHYTKINSSNHTEIDNYNHLYEVSLRFRLLRQQGYYVPADVFNIFKDKHGMFKEEMKQDIKGLMGLYEASQLRIEEDEDVLDEAANFTSQTLSTWVTNLDHHQGRIIGRTLENPYHKSLARSMVKNFLKDFKGITGWENVLEELAEMDYKLVQSKHQKEIFQGSQFWENLGLAKELKFARDQPLKWHMWSMAILTDSSLSEERIELTKPISLIYIIDDIFDVHGTLEELTLFTEAVNRWEFAAVEHLPDYMKISFKALYDTTNEIGYKIYKKHGRNPTESLRKAWATLCNAFLVEAKWFACGHSPKAEDYLKNGIVSSGVHVALTHIFFLLGHGLTNESADLVNDIPELVSSVATILRLWDDLGSAKDEDQDGHDGSYVHYYMKEHEGSSVELAQQRVHDMISDAWKCLNKECLHPSPFPVSFRNACVNVARMVPLMYSYDNNHHLPDLEEQVQQMLYGSVSL